MMVKRCPNLKEEVGGSNHGYEISSLLDKNLQGGQFNCLMCIGASRAAFCLKKKKLKKKQKL